MTIKLLASFRLLLVIIILTLGSTKSRAQFVPIPDFNFGVFLYAGGYLDSMYNPMLDTTRPSVLNVHKFNLSGLNVQNLEGIQYFKALDTLVCIGGYYPPTGLTYSPTLASIPAFPPSLIWLEVPNQFLTSLPDMPAPLIYCEAAHNQIQTIGSLSTSLGYLDLNDNNLSSFPTSIPPQLTELYCSGGNHIASMPVLNSVLQRLDWSGNNIGVWPQMPNTLFELDVNDCNLDSLPAMLPPSLTILGCGGNQLTDLPPLPPLQMLFCGGNQLTSLPSLGPFINWLSCGSNQLTSIPPLPPSMQYFNCSGNTGLTCLPKLGIIQSLDFSNTAVTCLPNYGTIANSNPLTTSLPLCDIYNPSGCNFYWNISGQAFIDNNYNCQSDTDDAPVHGAKMLLYSNGTLVQQVFADGQGLYSFQAPYGNYEVRVDTTSIPFIVSCPASGSLYDTLSAADSLAYDNNFAFQCRTQSIDAGVNSITSYVNPRPGITWSPPIIAGDMAQLYTVPCAGGISGQVTITYSGPMHYVSGGTGTPPNSVTGNTLTWNVADFGALDIYHTFIPLFAIDTFPPVNVPVCITVAVSSSGNDFNPGNNALTQCFPVVNSYDPNEKTVYPTTLDSLGKWLTYTIRFQNTGNAPAIHIKVTDTLQNNLDPTSFELLAASHQNITQVFGNVVVFNFPNINLPDSNANEPESHGYVQFRIKASSTIHPGDTISNKAFIYFDFNDPVITNSAACSFVPVSDSFFLTHSICTGETFNFLGQPLTATGTYYHTFTNAYGGDSVIQLSLTVAGLNEFAIDTTITQGTSITLPWGATVNTAGVYTDTLLSGSGCDTVVTVNLHVITGVLPLRVRADEITIFPNPVNNEVAIAVTEQWLGSSVTIYDMKGSAIERFTVQHLRTKLQTQSYPAGVYFMSYSSPLGKTTGKKFIKQ